MSGWVGEWLAAWVRLVERYHLATLGVLILFCAGALVATLEYGRINSDLDALVNPSDETQWYRQNELYKAEFPELQQTAVIVVSGPNFAEVQATTQTLAARLRATGEFPEVFAPGITDFVAHNKALFLDVEDLEQWLLGVRYNFGPALRLAEDASVANAIVVLADQASASRGRPLPESLASLAEGLTLAPPQSTLRLYPRLVDSSAETHYELVIAKGYQRLDQSLPNAEIVQRIRDILGELDPKSGTRVRLTGEVALAHEEISAALTGVGIAGSVSLVLLAIILGTGVRSPRLIGGIFALLGAGVLLTTGYATLAVGAYNTLALIFVVMFFGLGVDFAVHYGLRVQELGGSTGAATQAARDTGPAVALCMLTSMIAFLSFVPTAYRGLGELGLISAGGMAIAFALTVTLLPIVIGRHRLGDSRPVHLPQIPVPPKVVIGAFALLAMLAGVIAKDLRFDYSVLALRDPDTEGMRTLIELQEQGFATDYSISILADDAPHAATLKTNLETVDRVGAVATPLDYVPRNQEEKADRLREVLSLYADIESVERMDPGIALEDAAAYFLETPITVSDDDQSVIDSMTSLLERSPQSLAGLDGELERALHGELADIRKLLSAEPFSLDDVPAEFHARLISSDERHLVTVQPDEPLISREATEAFIQSVREVAPNIAGRSVVEWGVGNLVIESFWQALGISFAIIFLVLVAYFRALLLPIIVMVPIALSILLTLAVCQLTSLTINMANILVIPLIIGLGVDTGIHVTHRFVRDGSVEQVLHSSTARAVIISGLTTIGTFFSLSFSPHKGAASVGLLLTIAITLMLLVTFLLLPALLRQLKL